jgi:hypothetical protein
MEEKVGPMIGVFVYQINHNYIPHLSDPKENMINP